MKKRGRYILFALFAISVILNVLAWQSTAFCDFYVANIFPIWINTFGRFSGMFSFSVGELMIVLALVLLTLVIISGAFAVIFLLMKKSSEAKKKFKRIYKKGYCSLAWICVSVMLVMTLNCFLLYHCSTFSDKYMISEKEEYTLEELTVLRNYIVLKVNDLSKQIERDKNGTPVYSGSMEESAIASMQNLGKEYEQLAGFYPQPKEIKFSGFLSQQHMKGYYFPFSMEANYNGTMSVMNIPATMCHELAHLKGFIYEDEANLIGFLACINADDIFFQYGGYLSVLNYIDNDFYEALGRNKALYASHVVISKQVKTDNVFLTEEAWEEVEQKAVISTELVEKAADEFIETNLVLNGIADGSLSYGRVVGLLLDYYDGSFELEEEYLVKAQ